MKTNHNISSKFPFEPKYIEVNGSKVHYIDEGQGAPVLFIHGMPTSSYIWRNIIPHIKDSARCIAVDLIGMGKSDQPEIDYNFFTVYEYLEKFIDQMNLKDVTLVIHDWGSALGFRYAHLHQDNVRGIAFLEGMVSLPNISEMPFSTKMGLTMMRSKLFGPFMVKHANLMLKKLLPDLTMRKLTKEEMDHYQAPFPTPKSREKLLWGPRNIPFKGKPIDVEKAVLAYIQWLTTTDMPMLGFQVTPGVGFTPKDAAWAKANIENLELIDLGEGLHFLQEDYPHEIGEGISNWLKSLAS